ncbi:neutral/alkaline ceramidase [Pseudomonas sp. MBLB4123]|uniref:neutral/alkaline ceramidase n=1 Tax=Pseudomonas sp. MBLB4123 TaxID=3451557 RepID=UPI003F7513E2
MKRLLRIFMAAALSLPATLLAQTDNYLIGRGIYDITGPAAEASLFGYGSLDQSASGIHDRQWARAFIVADPQSGKRVVFVVIDSGATFQGVVQGVGAALKTRFGSLYDARNLVISATHTHSAAGGHSHYALYNITTNGYIEQNYKAQVNGIVAAIERAHQDLAPGRILLARGELWNASANRSQQAYYANRDAAQYPDIDPEMTVLKLVRNGQPVGMISWFATHGVSLPQSNTLLSGDNKGYAAYLFEKQLMGSDYGPGAFVAAFAQSNSGDMTPNLNLDGSGPGHTPEQSLRLIGQRQYDLARQLFEQASEALSGPIDFRHKYYDMSAQQVAAPFTEDGQSHRTCTAALGYGFGAGTEDGRGMDFFNEGQLQGNLFWQALTAMLTAPTEAQKACHAPRGLLLAQGNFKPYPWSPEVLPVSILKIGQLGLLAVPGEFTVMAGRRLRSTVAAVPGSGLQHLVVAGYSNAYAGYVTTQEEYSLGHYEGGSTHFGPWTLAAYRQALHEQASSLASGQPLMYAGEPQPRDLKDKQLTLQTGVVHDQAPLFKRIGDVVSQPAQRYSRGQAAKAVFWAGHPKNNLRPQGSFLQVQRLVGNQWQTVAGDNDWSTRFRWKRVDPIWGTSQATLEWDIDASVPAGTYRLRHSGTRKAPLTFKLHEYGGASRSFVVD